MRPPFAGLVAGLPVEVAAGLQMCASLLVVGHAAEGSGEDTVTFGPSDGVAQARRGVQRDALDSGQFLPAPLNFEVSPDDPGKLPGMPVEPVLGGDCDDCDQHALLSGEPALPVVDKFLGRDAWPRRGECHRVVLPAELDRDRISRMQVVVEDTVNRGTAVVLAVGESGLLRGIGT